MEDYGEERYWFPAKRFGWGWGLPLTWQGWLVLGGYAAMMAFFVNTYPPEEYPFEFAAGVSAASIVLLIICYKKGEPPRWRWGGRDERLP